MPLIPDATKEALKSGLSDMDYLRSKVAQTEDTEEEEEEEDDDGPLQHTDSDYESGDRENISKVKSSVTSEEKDQSKVKKPAKQEVTLLSEAVLNFYIQSLLLVCSDSHQLLCIYYRRREQQSSQWSWEESRSMLKRWVNKKLLSVGTEMFTISLWICDANIFSCNTTRNKLENLWLHWSLQQSGLGRTKAEIEQVW